MEIPTKEIIPTKLSIRPELLDLREFHTWEGMEIVEQEDFEVCGERLRLLAERKKQIKKDAEPTLKLVRDLKRDLDQRVKTVLEPIEKIDRTLRTKLGTAMDRRQRELDEIERTRRKEEAERLAREADAQRALAMETGSTTAVEAAENKQRDADKLSADTSSVRQTMRFESGRVAQSTKWVWSVHDAGKIPREYFVLDEKKINAIARAYGKTPIEIPGIVFEKKSTVQVTT